MQFGVKNIEDFFQRYSSAAWEKDVAGMIGLYDEDVTIFDMWDKGFSQGLPVWSAIIEEWLTSLNEERVKVVFEMIEIHGSGHVAFASALIGYQAIAADNSVQRSMKNRITLGFVRRDDFWKVKHQHTSAPIDPELRAILDL